MIPDIKRIEERVIGLEADRDRVMQLSKDLIRMAGKTIALMHAQGPEVAAGMMSKLKSAKLMLEGSEKGFEYYSLQAHQEYSEALILHGILSDRKIPSMKRIGESEGPYLLGLMDAVGELKREILESIRKGDKENAKAYYKIMADIYDSTLHMRFANSILPDFRRKQDTARIQLESVMNEMLHL